MTLVDVLRALRRYWWIALLCATLGAAGMFGLSQMQRPVYAATSQVFVSVSTSRGAQDLSQGATFVQSQVASYADLASTPYVLEPVAGQLNYPGGVEALRKSVTATSSRDTVIVAISARDTDAQRAAQVANAVASELGTAVRQVSPRGSDGSPLVQVSTVSRATVPGAPATPKTIRNAALGEVAGLLLGLVAAVVVDRWRRTARSRKSGRAAEAHEDSGATALDARTGDVAAER